VELRKRKAAAAAAPAPPPKKANSVKGAVAKAKETVKEVVGKKETTSNGKSSGKVAQGSTIALEGFGGEIETNDGQKTTLKKLVNASKAGVVLFTYPKASTPGCKLYTM
jgi:peroxiredoxin Q/BCP